MELQKVVCVAVIRRHSQRAACPASSFEPPDPSIRLDLRKDRLNHALSVGAGGKLSPLRRLKMHPSWAVVASGGLAMWSAAASSSAQGSARYSFRVKAVAPSPKVLAIALGAKE